MDAASAAPTPGTYDSVPSSTSNSPEPILDDYDGDFPIQQAETQSSQSSYSGSTSRGTSRAPSPRPARALERKNPVERLPDELLICIFAKLGAAADLYAALRVCKLWARCSVDLLWHRPLFTSWPRLQSVAAALQAPRPAWPYHQLVRRLNLASLSPDVNDGTLQPFAPCTRIERLTLTGCHGLTDRGLLGLVEGNRGLLALDVTGVAALTDVTVRALAQHCPRLQGLNVTGCRYVTDESLVPLAHACKYLKRLKLNKCSLVTDESIVAFAQRCPSMLEIDLQCCEAITDAAVVSLLHGGRYLRELRLAQCPLISDLAFLPPLASSSAHPPGGGGGAAPPRPHPPAPRFDGLRILDLTACARLTDAAVEAIVERAPRLRILVLAKCTELTDRAVHAVARLGKNLHDVHLGRCVRVSDDALRDLVRCCSRIRYIDLAGCTRVTDASVRQLATLPKLRRIGLVKCQNITDQSIVALARGPGVRDGRSAPSTLERVHLSYCIQVSIPGVHELLNSCERLTHLSLTGIAAFHEREDLIQFCREAPSEFNEQQRDVFCVFSGDGVHRLRAHLNATEPAAPRAALTRAFRQHAQGGPPLGGGDDGDLDGNPALAGMGAGAVGLGVGGGDGAADYEFATAAEAADVLHAADALTAMSAGAPGAAQPPGPGAPAPASGDDMAPGGIAALMQNSALDGEDFED